MLSRVRAGTANVGPALIVIGPMAAAAEWERVDIRATLVVWSSP